MLSRDSQDDPSDDSSDVLLDGAWEESQEGSQENLQEGSQHSSQGESQEDLPSSSAPGSPAGDFRNPSQLLAMWPDDEVDVSRLRLGIHHVPPEPTLPTLPPPIERPKTPQQQNRKRNHVETLRHSSSSAYNSSDPAFFTSEDDEAVDNYVEGQRKKRYTSGTWFERHPTSSEPDSQETPRPPKPAKRVFSRQTDSGVWMGSDPIDDGFVVPELPVRARLPQLNRTALKQLSNAEQAAASKIQQCLDASDEAIELSNKGIERLPNEIIGLLSEFVLEPPVAKDVPFEPREPELKLWLGNNRLTAVPGAVFDLTFLTDLSLRANNLKEIPPAIYKLKNLRSLNVGQNQLRHLPSSLIHLLDGFGPLQTLILHPNPFVQPLAITSANFPTVHRPDHKVPDHRVPRWMTKHVARTPLQVSSSTGRVLSTFRLDQDLRRPRIFPFAKDHVPPENSPAMYKVPSLVESVLKTAYRSERLDELREHVPADMGYLADLLDRVRDQKLAGGHLCSGCGTRIIVPVLEWIEWRAIKHLFVQPNNTWVYTPLSETESEALVPFLHRACSWRCRPSKDDSLPAKHPWLFFTDGTYKEMRVLDKEYSDFPLEKYRRWGRDM